MPARKTKPASTPKKVKSTTRRGRGKAAPKSQTEGFLGYVKEYNKKHGNVKPLKDAMQSEESVLAEVSKVMLKESKKRKAAKKVVKKVDSDQSVVSTVTVSSTESVQKSDKNKELKKEHKTDQNKDQKDETRIKRRKTPSGCVQKNTTIKKVSVWQHISDTVTSIFFYCLYL